MNNEEAARIFIDAIQQLANKPDNLYNLECYLSHHFCKWLKTYANTPEGITIEIKHFAEMEI